MYSEKKRENEQKRQTGQNWRKQVMDGSHTLQMPGYTGRAQDTDYDSFSPYTEQGCPSEKAKNDE